MTVTIVRGHYVSKYYYEPLTVIHFINIGFIFESWVPGESTIHPKAELGSDYEWWERWLVWAKSIKILLNPDLLQHQNPIVAVPALGHDGQGKISAIMNMYSQIWSGTQSIKDLVRE